MTDEPKPKRRIPSIMGDDARAEAGREARESRRTPREDVPSVEFDAEETSQTYEGEQLREWREGLPIDRRVSRLEVKHDELTKKLDESGKRFDANITEIKADVKRVATASDQMAGTVGEFIAATRQKQQADAMAQALQQSRPHSDSIMRAVKETTTVTLAERVLDERDKSRKFRRTFILTGLKLATALAGAGGVGAFIHWLLQKLNS